MLGRPGALESLVVLDQQKQASSEQKEKDATAPAEDAAPSAPTVKQFISYFLVETKMLKHPVHKEVQLAYLWYHHAPTGDQLRTLVKDVMIHAASKGVDMLICHNQEPLQFGLSPARLRCYIYNYQVQLQPEDVGIVMI